MRLCSPSLQSVDLLTLGLVVLLPVIGLVAISRRLIALLAVMLTLTAAGVLAAINASDLPLAMTDTGVSFYLYLATFLFAAFVAKDPPAHTRLILNAYVWAAAAAASAEIVGYFDLLPDAHELMTRYGRATGLFKDPNVFGPFLVPALVYGLSILNGIRLRKSVPLLGLMMLIGLALLLSFSRGAWFNLGVAAADLRRPLHFDRRQPSRTFEIPVACGCRNSGSVQRSRGGSAVRCRIRAGLGACFSGPGLRSGAGGPLRRPAEGGRFDPAVSYSVLARNNSCRSITVRSLHNVYLTMFLNNGWVGGLLFIALVGLTCVWGLRHAFVRCATQPMFQVVYGCFVANVLEGAIIDLDHWRHFYLLMALAWGLMLSIPKPSRSPSEMIMTAPRGRRCLPHPNQVHPSARARRAFRPVHASAS